MATAEERYAAATAYVRRAVSTVEARGIAYAIDPVTGLVEWYAGRTKTEAPRNERTAGRGLSVGSSRTGTPPESRDRQKDQLRYVSGPLSTSSCQ